MNNCHYNRGCGSYSFVAVWYHNKFVCREPAGMGRERIVSFRDAISSTFNYMDWGNSGNLERQGKAEWIKY